MVINPIKRYKEQRFYASNTIIGMGSRITQEVVLKDLKEYNEIIVLPDEDRKSHFWCFGTTRVGKTRVMEGMIEQDIRKKNNLVIIDPKGDMELFAKVVEEAKRFGREKELMLLSAVYPEFSIKINPMSHYFMPEELVGHVVSGIKEGFGNEFYYNVAYEVSIVIIESLLEIKRHENGADSKLIVTLEDIKNLIGRNEIVRLLYELRHLPETDRNLQLISDVGRIASSPQEYYSKVITSLRVALMELTRGNIGRILCATRENKLIDKLEKDEGVILMVHLGSLLTRRAAYSLGKVIISVIMAYVGRVYHSNRGKTKVPLCLYMDEAQSLLFRGIDELFAKAGGAGVWVHGFCQTESQLFSNLGTEEAKTILSNTNSQLFMRVQETETAKRISEKFGEISYMQPYLSTNGGFSARESKRLAVEHNQVLDLKKREFFYKTYKGNFKGVTRDVKSSNIKIALPDIKA